MVAKQRRIFWSMTRQPTPSVARLPSAACVARAPSPANAADVASAAWRHAEGLQAPSISRAVTILCSSGRELRQIVDPKLLFDGRNFFHVHFEAFPGKRL